MTMSYDNMDDITHSGLNDITKKLLAEYGPIPVRHFIQITMCCDNENVYRNALDNEGCVCYWGDDDWVPLPSCPTRRI